MDEINYIDGSYSYTSKSNITGAKGEDGTEIESSIVGYTESESGTEIPLSG